MKRLLGPAASLVLTACATGGNPATPERDAAVTPPVPDAFDPGTHDAGPIDPPLPDAAPPDAPPPDAFISTPDAPPDACVPTNTQLLANPVFDLTPVGTGWQQTLIDPAAPLVTDQDGVPEHSAPFKAWLGGIASPSTSSPVTDVLIQDVVVPPLTSELVLSGVFDVRTAETSTTFAFDTADFSVTRTDGTPIASVLSLSNLTPQTGWTSFEVTLPPGLSGQTIRIRMTSSNDFTDETSFYFDSFALVATHGCP